jgi:hypothetical protein
MKEIVKHKISQVEVAANDLEGAYIAADVVDMSTGEVIVDANSELTPVMIGKLLEAGMDSFEVFFPERDEVGNGSHGHHQERCDQDPQRCADRDLPQAASLAIRPRSIPPASFSRACSSTRASTTFPAWAA